MELNFSAIVIYVTRLELTNINTATQHLNFNYVQTPRNRKIEEYKDKAENVLREGRTIMERWKQSLEELTETNLKEIPVAEVHVTQANREIIENQQTKATVKMFLLIT